MKHVICIKNVRAATACMQISNGGLLFGTKVPSWVFCTLLQDFKKSISIFLLTQGLRVLQFLNEILHFVGMLERGLKNS